MQWYRNQVNRWAIVLQGLFQQWTWLQLGFQFRAVAAPENFFVGGHRGGKIRFWGGKLEIQKIAENGWFWPYFSSDWGQVGGGANAPMPPLMPPLIQSEKGGLLFQLDSTIWFLYLIYFQTYHFFLCLFCFSFSSFFPFSFFFYF